MPPVGQVGFRNFFLGSFQILGASRNIPRKFGNSSNFQAPPSSPYAQPVPLVQTVQAPAFNTQPSWSSVSPKNFDSFFLNRISAAPAVDWVRNSVAPAAGLGKFKKFEKRSNFLLLPPKNGGKFSKSTEQISIGNTRGTNQYISRPFNRRSLQAVTGIP